MIPILYRADGSCVGPLTDCTRCYTTQERNGLYEAEIDYPMSSPLFSEISDGCYCMVKTDDVAEPQKMTIYGQTKPLYGITTLHCQHWRYRLNDVPVARGRYTGTPASVLENMAVSVDSTTDFTFWSDISAVKTIEVTVPTTLGKLLAGQEGSVLDVFGGEYEFNNDTVKLHQSRGLTRSTEIRYAKNLTGFTCEKDSSRTYTHVYPYYYSEVDNAYVELQSKTITLSGADSLPFKRCYMLDLSASFDNTPTAAQLEAKTQSFINANQLDTISYSYQVSFVPLWQTTEYKNISALERCSLCDTVPVIHDKAGERVRAKIIRTVYDGLAERYVNMELGNSISGFAQTVAQNLQQIDGRINKAKSFLQIVVRQATATITGNRGGYVVLYDSNGDGEPDEILIMDTPSILTAVHVWRWNVSGLGYSDHGYGGPYTTAITMQGSINADFVTTGTLLADLIKAGIISDVSGNVAIDMANGAFTMKIDNGTSMKLWRNGLTFYGTNTEVMASMFISANGKGVTTSNRILVGTRDNEKVDIGVSNNKGYVKADELIVGSGSSVTSIGTDDYMGTDRAYVTTKDLYSDKFYTNILAVNGITFAPTTVTVNGTQYTMLCRP